MGRLVPRRSAPVVLCDEGEGLAERGAGKLAALGYSDVRGARRRDGGVARGRPSPVHRHQRAEQGVRRIRRARVRHALDLGRGAEGDDGPERARRGARQPADGRVPGDEHSGRGCAVRGGAGASGRRCGARSGHPRGGQLRGPHPQHHRRPVAHQRGRSEPGRRASQRHHGLAPGGLRARPRPKQPSAAARSGVAGRFGTRGETGRPALRGRVRGRGDARRVAGGVGRTHALRLRREESRGVSGGAIWRMRCTRRADNSCRRPTTTPPPSERGSPWWTTTGYGRPLPPRGSGRWGGRRSWCAAPSKRRRW